MLYAKLVLRSIHRHSKKGKRLFVLIALCVAAAVFLLSMRDSFVDSYAEMIIDYHTCHVAVVSPESEVLSGSVVGKRKQELALIEVDDDLLAFSNGLEHVVKVSPAVETGGIFFALDGEAVSDFGVAGIAPDDFPVIFPGRELLEGSLDFAYHEGDADIPVVRLPLEDWEKIENSDVFVRTDIRYEDGEYREFQKLVQGDFPAYFEGVDAGAGDEPNGFLAALAKALQDPDLHMRVPNRFFEEYDWRIDDRIAYAQAVRREMTREVAKANKRLVQSLYPDAIAPVREEITMNKPLTLVIPSAKNVGTLNNTVVLPVQIVGFVQKTPLFWVREVFVDVEVLQEYLELGSTEYTSLLVRLDSRGNASEVAAKLQAYLEDRGLDYRAVDFTLTGKEYMGTAIAVRFTATVLIFLFVIMVVVFVVNMVLLSIVKRRREIGTSIAMGMSASENVWLLVAETGIIVTISWAFGSLLATGVIWLFSRIGLPGIFFFPENRLYFTFDFRHIVYSYTFILPSSLLAALIPALSVRKMEPVTLLRDTN